jgi:anti-sigma B factor antagonist
VRKDVLVQILEITTRRYRRFEVVALHGELDLAGAAELRSHLREACKTNNDRQILDLEDLAFIDSTGLSILVEFHLKTKAAGGGLILTGVQPAVARVFGITGLHNELRTADGLADAATELERIGREPGARPEGAEV